MDNLFISVLIPALVGCISALFVTRDRIRYEKLYVEQAESIKKIYQLISDCYQKFHSYTNRLQDSVDLSLDEKRKNTGESYNQFSNFFEQNRIFFPKYLCERIENLRNEFNSVWSIMELSKDLKDTSTGGSKERIEAWDKVDKKILILKTELENEFKQIIGIE